MDFKIGDEFEEVNEEESKNKKSSNNIFPIIIIAVVSIVCGVVVFLVSNTLFGKAGYTGTVKKGNGAVTARRKIFNNTELGKAINTIIKANDGEDDYFGPLENTRHFGKAEHLS